MKDVEKHEYPMTLERVERRWKTSKPLREVYHQWHKKIMSQIKETDKVLEIGCGVGLFAESLTKKFPQIDYAGIDYVARATKLAKKRAPKGKFQVGNIEHLNFKPDSFDIVVGIDVLHHADLDIILSDVSKILKQGGRFIILEPAVKFFGKNLRKLVGHHENIDKYPDEKKLTTSLKKHKLSIKKVKFISAIDYPLTGGFSKKEFIKFGWPLILRLDKLLSLVPTFCSKIFIITEK